MTIKVQKSISWINDCGCVIDLELLSKAVLWYANAPVQKVKHIYLYGEYAAVSIGREKVHVHRLLMEFSIGHKLDSKLSVHHLDENKLNDEISNLAIMVNKYHNQHHMENFKPSEKQIAATIEANHRRKGTHNAKHINIPYTELRSFISKGKSINWIANFYGCDWPTINARIHENPELLEVDSK